MNEPAKTQLRLWIRIRMCKEVREGIRHALAKRNDAVRKMDDNDPWWATPAAKRFISTTTSLEATVRNLTTAIENMEDAQQCQNQKSEL